MTKGQQATQVAQQEELRPEELFRPLDQIRKNAPPLEPLWGYFLFKKAITAIVGDPGICKTTLGYGLGMNLCRGMPFLEVSSEEPVKLLYLDFESADSLVASRASMISEELTPNFWVYNIIDYYLPQLAQVVIQFCREKGINLVFIDSQSLAFHTRDENDNAEAIQQMRMIRAIFSSACSTSTVLFHHTSKADLHGTRKGSGAFARARLADIAINLEHADKDNSDVIKLETVKNRFVDERVLWYLKKSEGQFVFTDPPLGVKGVPTGTQIYKAQKAVLEIMQNPGAYRFSKLVGLMEAKGFSANWTDHAVRRLIQQGRLFRPCYGYYQKKEYSQGAK